MWRAAWPLQDVTDPHQDRKCWRTLQFSSTPSHPVTCSGSSPFGLLYLSWCTGLTGLFSGPSTPLGDRKPFWLLRLWRRPPGGAAELLFQPPNQPQTRGRLGRATSQRGAPLLGWSCTFTPSWTRWRRGRCKGFNNGR